jgi:pilus assembly protein CpaB
MKKHSSLITLGFAVLCGIVAVILFNQWQSGRPLEQTVVLQDTMPVVEIVVAARDIEVGGRLTPESLTLVKWPQASVPQGAFQEIDQLSGRVAVTKLNIGEPVLAAELAGPGSGAGLVASIPPGMRAMSIRVDEVIGVAGFILPNTQVDVIGVESDKDGNKTAKTILEKIQVLAIAQDTFTEEGKAKVVKTVTLMVKPEQTEKLALQTHKGAIHLVLRNPMDEQQPKPEEKIVEIHRPAIQILKKRVYAPKPKPFAVEVIRASKRENIQFKNKQSEDVI